MKVVHERGDLRRRGRTGDRAHEQAIEAATVAERRAICSTVAIVPESVQG